MSNDRHPTPAGDYNRYDDEPDAVLTPDSSNGRRLSRGREAPARARKLVQVVVNETVLGEIDANEITAGAQFDLEDCQTAHALVDWMVTYAGSDRDETIKALRPMALQAIMDLLLEVSTALGQAVEVPKRNARR